MEIAASYYGGVVMKSSVRSIVFVMLMVGPLTGAMAWSTDITKDEMTGEVNAYASSPATTATKEMGFPYTGTRAWLGVGCDTGDEWAYVGFSKAPNLNKTETKDGYNEISTRIKWDDDVTITTLDQEWGERFLHFANGDEAISKIMRKGKVLLELDWHSQGERYFRFSLDGSAKAISEIRAACSQ